MEFINILHTEKRSSLGSRVSSEGKPLTSNHIGEIIDAVSLPARIKGWGEKEGYFQLWDLESGLTDYSGFFGPHRPALSRFYFDFDSTKDLDESRKDSLAFLQMLKEKGADLSLALIYFSGKKGFHLALPAQWFGINDECWDEQANLKAFCEYLKEGSDTDSEFKGFTSIDVSVTTKVGRLRIPGSRHDSTGLFKTRLTLTQLETLDDGAIRSLARDRYTITEDELLPPQAARIKQIANWYEEEAEKRRASDYEKTFSSFASTFTTYPDKLCLKRLEQDKLGEGDRHRAMTILASYFYHTKVSREEAETRLQKFAALQGLDQTRIRREPSQIIRAIYTGRHTYDFGCNERLKASRCSDLCEIRACLKPENRPELTPLSKQKDEALIEEIRTGSTQAPELLTKQSGYWKKVGKTIQPAYEDLLKEFKNTYNYRTYLTASSPETGSGVRPILWNGTHWVNMYEIQYIAKIWMEEVMNPKPQEKHRAEFASKVKVHNIIDGSDNPSSVDSFFVDSIKDRVNLQNGVYNLKTGELESRTSDLGFTYVLPFAYDETAQCPRFLEFLKQISDGDTKLADRIMLFLAYALYDPFYERHYILLLLGNGGNGKGTLARLIANLFGGPGGGYAPLGIEAFTSRFDSSRMENKLIGVIEELAESETTKAVWNRIKEATGGGWLKVERKNKDSYSVRSTCKLIFCSNEVPSMKDSSMGIKRRMRTVWLDKNFTENASYDPKLDEKLRAELPGIFNLIVKDYGPRFLKDGIPTGTDDDEITADLMADENPLDTFLNTCIAYDGDKSKSLKAVHIWAAFELWIAHGASDHVGEKHPWITFKTMMKKIRMRHGKGIVHRVTKGRVILGSRFLDALPMECRPDMSKDIEDAEY